MLSGDIYAEAIETKSFVSDSIVKWLLSPLFDKISPVESQIYHFFIVYSCGDCTNFKTFLRKLWLVIYLDWPTIFWDSKCISSFKFGFFVLSERLAVEKRQKVGRFDIFWFQINQKNLSKSRNCDKLRLPMNVLVPIIFHVTGKNIFKDRIVPAANAALDSLIVG